MTLYVDGVSIFCFAIAFIIALYVVHLLRIKSHAEGYWEGFAEGQSEMRRSMLKVQDGGQADAPIYSNGEQIWPKSSQK